MPSMVVINSERKRERKKERKKKRKKEKKKQAISKVQEVSSMAQEQLRIIPIREPGSIRKLLVRAYVFRNIEHKQDSRFPFSLHVGHGCSEGGMHLAYMNLKDGHNVRSRDRNLTKSLLHGRSLNACCEVMGSLHVVLLS
jgi:hypothetical protein